MFRSPALRALLLLPPLLFLGSCSTESSDDPCIRFDLPCDAPGWPPNVLLVVADDIGADLIGSYGAGASAPPTPTLDTLAAEGVRYLRAYSTPWCSATRAGILTGRYGSRFGIGRAIVVSDPDDVSLPDDAKTLPELLSTASPWPWSQALVGKWHLTTFADGAVDAPRRQGFDHFRGHVGNLYASHARDGEAQGYFDWERIVDGEVARTTRYATTTNVDDALELIGDMSHPWFLMLAFNAAHEPFEAPPADLHSRGSLGRANERHRAGAMIEAMDRELGRLLGALPDDVREDTLVVFAGDNGQSFEGPQRKGTVYEGGVRVPLIIAGAGVEAPGRLEEAFVQTNDLFALVLDIAGVPESKRPETDAISPTCTIRRPYCPPARELVYLESFAPNGPGPYALDQRSVRDEAHKLIARRNRFELYAIGEGVEGTDLLRGPALEPTAQAAFDRLSAEIVRISGRPGPPSPH